MFRNSNFWCPPRRGATAQCGFKTSLEYCFARREVSGWVQVLCRRFFLGLFVMLRVFRDLRQSWSRSFGWKTKTSTSSMPYYFSRDISPNFKDQENYIGKWVRKTQTTFTHVDLLMLRWCASAQSSECLMIRLMCGILCCVVVSLRSSFWGSGWLCLGGEFFPSVHVFCWESCCVFPVRKRFGAGQLVVTLKLQVPQFWGGWQNVEKKLWKFAARHDVATMTTRLETWNQESLQFVSVATSCFGKNRPLSF